MTGAVLQSCIPALRASSGSRDVDGARTQINCPIAFERPYSKAYRIEIYTSMPVPGLLQIRSFAPTADHLDSTPANI